MAGPSNPTAPQQAARVEVVVCGLGRKMLLINGHRIDRVLEIDLDLGRRGELGPTVKITLHTADIQVREVDSEEFLRLAA